MALNAIEIRAGLTGNLYSAPIVTAMPTDTATALPVAWKELGYLTDDGLAITPDQNVEGTKAWQTQYEVRRVVTERTFTVKFKLLQRNTDNLLLAMGGGTVTVTGVAPNTVSTYVPPAGNVSYERAFVLEVRDGTVIDRWCLYRGFPHITGDVVAKTSEAAGFELEVSALADATGNTWKLVSNDAALVAG